MLMRCRVSRARAVPGFDTLCGRVEQVLHLHSQPGTDPCPASPIESSIAPASNSHELMADLSGSVSAGRDCNCCVPTVSRAVPAIRDSREIPPHFMTGPLVGAMRSNQAADFLGQLCASLF